MKTMRASKGWTRRELLASGVGVVGAIWVRELAAAPQDLASAIVNFSLGAPVRAVRRWRGGRGPAPEAQPAE